MPMAPMMNKPYTINKSEDGNTVEVNLYGEVVESVPIDWWTGEKVEGLFIEGKQFLADLEELDTADKVVFHINSVGGDVEMGISIYNRIRSMKATTTTIVDGLAASAASIIAQAGDTRQISTGAQLMIHGASAGLVGFYNREDLKKIDNMLSAINKSAADIYAERASKDDDHIESMMAKEKWMTAEEALEEGFVDEIAGKEPEVVGIEGRSSMLLVNGVPQNMRGIPMPEMPVSGTVKLSREKEGSLDMDIDKNEEGRSKAMTVQDLEAANPELVEQIRSEATATAVAANGEAVKNALEADRKRMRDIDSIALAVGDPELVNKAKYDEPMEAAQLALIAMQNQQAKGDAFLAARAEETKPAEDVVVNANSGMEDTVAQDEAELEALVNKIKEEK